jgi:hypothetical protein
MGGFEESMVIPFRIDQYQLSAVINGVVIAL